MGSGPLGELPANLEIAGFLGGTTYNPGRPKISRYDRVKITPHTPRQGTCVLSRSPATAARHQGGLR